MSKVNINIDSNYYNNHKKECDERSSYGIEYTPVNSNGAFIPTSKDSSSNLEKTQENILDRFGLN